MKLIFYTLLFCNFLLQTAPLHAAASSWFGTSKDQPHYPAVSPLRALGAYISDSLPDIMVAEADGTRKLEGFNTWFTQHIENIGKLKRPEYYRKDIVDRARTRLAESLYIVSSPSYEYEFSVHVPASLRVRTAIPATQSMLDGILEPLVLHVKVHNKDMQRAGGEYDLLFTKLLKLGQPSSYTIYDGTGTYNTADRSYKETE